MPDLEGLPDPPAGGARALEPVAGRDGVWLQDSPSNLMVIHSVLALDRLDLETLRELWQTRVMAAGGGRRYARFKKRVVTRGSRAYWQEDPEFSLDRHIFVPAGAAALADRDSLQRYLGGLASQPLPEDRPRWQLLLIPDFGQERGSAVIVRIHHCMGDGIGLVPVLFSLMDSTPDGGGMLMPAVIDRAGKPPNKLALAARTALVGPFLLAAKLLWRRDRNPLHGPPLSGDKRVAWTPPLDLARVKAARDELGATVNDVLVACVAGGLRRYVRDGHGEDLQRLRASMPINIRSRFESLEMDNKFAAVLLPLSAGVADARDRVDATRRQMGRLKRSIEPYFTYVTVNVLQKLLPAAASRALIDFLANKCTCVLTNVPGPQTRVYVAGRRLRTWLFWVPQRADIGVGISILTLSGELRIGVLADVALIADPQALVAAFEAELAELIG
jgi:diacylglycerol O-acyltransferase / wax synthase